MSIAWYRPEDLPALIRTYESVFQFTRDEPAFFNWTQASFLSELRISKTLLFKFDDQVASFLMFREQPDWIEVMVLGTHQAHQKKAGMSGLIVFLQEYAAQHDKSIQLEVHEKNRAAVRLYLKNAFELSHLRMNYYNDGGAAAVYAWKKRPQLE